MPTLEICAGKKTVGKTGQIPSGTCVGCSYREQKYMLFKNSQSLQSLFSLLFTSHTHMQTSSASQVQRMTYCGIWCLLKEINKQEQALSKAVLTDRHWNELPFHKQLSYVSLQWTTFTTITSSNSSLRACVQQLSNMVKRQAGTWISLFCTLHAHTRTHVSMHTHSSIPHLNLWM